MKKAKALLLAGLVMIGIAGTACAEHYGPLKSSLAAGEMSTGIGYSYDAMEWNGENSTLETRRNRLYVQLGVGVGKDWELATRVGGADLVINDGFQDSNDKFSGNLRPTAGLNFGGPIYRGRTLSIGPFVQGNYTYLYDDIANGSVTDVASGGIEKAGREKVSVKHLWDATAGFKFQLELEGAHLYFGPSFTLGKGNYRSAFIADDLTLIQGFEDSLNPQRSFATFAGIRWQLPDNWPTATSRVYLDLEVQFKNNPSVSTALNITF